jgi:hypothetical protein
MRGWRDHDANCSLVRTCGPACFEREGESRGGKAEERQTKGEGKAEESGGKAEGKQRNQTERSGLG